MVPYRHLVVAYELATKYTWRFHNDNFGSDHLPLLSLQSIHRVVPVEFKKVDIHCLASYCSSYTIVGDDVDQG